VCAATSYIAARSMLWAKACAECCAERAAGRCVRCLCCNADVLGGITCVVVQLGIRDCLSKIWRRCGVVKRDPLCRAMGRPSWQARMREPRLRRQVSQCTYIKACHLEEMRVRRRTVVHEMKDGRMKRSTRARAHHHVWGDKGLWAGVWVWEAGSRCGFAHLCVPHLHLNRHDAVAHATWCFLLACARVLIEPILAVGRRRVVQQRSKGLAFEPLGDGAE
jgi:hypothetical protein